MVVKNGINVAFSPPLLHHKEPTRGPAPTVLPMGSPLSCQHREEAQHPGRPLPLLLPSGLGALGRPWSLELSGSAWLPASGLSPGLERRGSRISAEPLALSHFIEHCLLD